MIPMQGTPGALFNLLGRIGKCLSQMRTYQLAQLTNLTDVNVGLVGQMDLESDLQALVGNAYLAQLSSPESVGGLGQSVAAQWINRAVFRDNPRLNQTLTSINTPASIQEVIRQMTVNGDSVLTMTITGTPTSFVGVGDGVVIFSSRRPLDGLVMENTFAETIKITCTQDSYTGGATPGNEGMTVQGQGNQSDVFAFNWPLGSNCNFSSNCIDGNTDNGSGNILTNTGFANWTGAVPDNFAVVTGGGIISEETTIVFDNNGSSLRITGDGATLVSLRQVFNDGTNGTAGTLSPLTQYGFNVYLRRGGVPLSTGQLTIDLVDAAFNVISDENGVANSFTIDLTTSTVNFTSFTGVFRTPRIMPSTYYWRMYNPVGNPVSNVQLIYLEKCSLGLMAQCYTSGSFLSIHSGANPFNAGDYMTLAISNSRGSGGSLNTFQTLVAMLLPDFIASEFLLPSSAFPTISDNLITA